MKNTYVIINENNELVNIVVWDGNIENWNPPENTRAIKLEKIDLNTIIIPSNPDLPQTIE